VTTTPTPTGQDTTLRLAYNPAGMQTEIHTPSRAWRTRLAADEIDVLNDARADHRPVTVETVLGSGKRVRVELADAAEITEVRVWP